MFEQDYIVRQIKECVAAAMKLVFGIEIDNAAAMEFDTLEKKSLSDKLKLQIDKGDIKGALSEMYLNSIEKTKDDLLIGLIVYTYIYEKNDNFIDSCSINYSEIRNSAKEYFSKFGIPEVSELILFD